MDPGFPSTFLSPELEAEPESSWKYRELPIHFPYQPYVSQKRYTEHVVDAILDGNNALLESPTGTGKTLALLCGGVAAVRAVRRASKAKTVLLYASRTHSQLAQVVSQLQHVWLGGLKAVVLGSREQLCLNPVVKSKSSAGEKVALCNTLVKGHKCDFHRNFSQTEVQFEAGRDVCDIEDLVKVNRKRKICPYFSSRDLAGHADLVFLPYNYLLDVGIRKTLSVSLNQSVVILDEAHNVGKTCEESASISFEVQDVALALHEIDTVLKLMEKKDDMDIDLDSSGVELSVEDLLLAKEALSQLEDTLCKAFAEKRLQYDRAVQAGILYTLLEEGGFGFERHVFISGILQSVVDLLQLLQSMGGRETGKGINTFLTALRTIYSSSDPVAVLSNMNQYFRLFIKRCQRHANNSIFELWCFHPGFSMQSLFKSGVRSIILTSGTLKPLSTFAKELDLPFPIQFTGEHVIDKGQLCVRSFRNGRIANVDLLSTFQNRENKAYITSLGQSIVDICREVPNGMLVFFPSYSLMTNTINAWQSSGLWSRIGQYKATFVEPKGKDDFNTIIAQYRQTVDTPSGSGACLFAVCRGKVAEGIDFSDKAARAVVILGIPYPSLYDSKVKAKKEYMDSRKVKDAAKLNGGEWYRLEAFRAINQAIGRVIRHKNDFGAVIFLDRRFSDAAVMKDISDWVSANAAKASSYEAGLKDLTAFYASFKNSFKGAAQPVWPSVSGSTKRALTTPSACDNKAKQARPEPPQANRKIVLKRQVDNVLKYKAANIVVKLKERLSKEEMLAFKERVKAYKEKANFDDLLGLCKNLVAEEKIMHSELEELKMFVRAEDLDRFQAFIDTPI